MQVRHILQNKGRDIIGVADSATLGDAARILVEHHIGALMIQDSGGALVGIFSERDLVRAVEESIADSLIQAKQNGFNAISLKSEDGKVRAKAMKLTKNGTI